MWNQWSAGPPPMPPPSSVGNPQPPLIGPVQPVVPAPPTPSGPIPLTPSAVPAVQPGAYTASAAPSYTPAQFAAMTPEQQYAVQQHWQQWRAYEQQYAQWHAQYGEQYKREMAAIHGAPQQTVSPYSAAPITNSYSYPPPVISNSYQVQSAPLNVPPPPPPDDNANSTGIKAPAQLYEQPPPPPPPPQQEGNQPNKNDTSVPPLESNLEAHNEPPSKFSQNEDNRWSQPPPSSIPHSGNKWNESNDDQQSSTQLSRPPPKNQYNQQERQQQNQYNQQDMQQNRQQQNQYNQNDRQQENQQTRQPQTQFNQQDMPQQNQFSQEDRHHQNQYNQPLNPNNQQLNPSNQQYPPNFQQFNRNNQQFNPNNQQFNPNNNQNQQFNPNNQQFNPNNEQFNPNTQQFNANNQRGRQFQNQFRDQQREEQGRNNKQGSGQNNNNFRGRNNRSRGGKNYDNERQFEDSGGRNNYQQQSWQQSDSQGIRSNRGNYANCFDNSNENFNTNIGQNNQQGPSNWNNSNQGNSFGAPEIQRQQTVPQQQRNANENTQQPSKGGSLDEKAFDEQFKMWEEQFENWKKENANHPDRVMYMQYEREFEKTRVRLLERREQMRRRKMMEMQQSKPQAETQELEMQQQAPLQPKLPNPEPQEQTKLPLQQPIQTQQEKPLQVQDLNQDSETIKSDEKSKETQKDAKISEQKQGSDMEQSDTEGADLDISKKSADRLEKSPSETEAENVNLPKGSIFKNQEITELFKSGEGIPGLDLVSSKDGDEVDKPMIEKQTTSNVIDLENDGPSRPAKVSAALSTTTGEILPIIPKSQLQPCMHALVDPIPEEFPSSSQSLNSQPLKRKIPSLFDIVIEKPVLSPNDKTESTDPQILNSSPTESKSSKADIDNTGVVDPLSGDRELPTPPAQRPLSHMSTEKCANQPASDQPMSNLPPQAADLAKALQDPNVMQLLSAALAQAQKSGGINPANPQQNQLLQQLQQLQPLIRMQQDKNTNSQSWDNSMPQQSQQWQHQNQNFNNRFNNNMNQNQNFNNRFNANMNQNRDSFDGNPFNRSITRNEDQINISRGTGSANDSNSKNDLPQKNPRNPFRRGPGSEDNVSIGSEGGRGQLGNTNNFQQQKEGNFGKDNFAGINSPRMDFDRNKFGGADTHGINFNRGNFGGGNFGGNNSGGGNIGGKGYDNFGRGNFASDNFGRENFNRDNLSRENFDRENFGRGNFGVENFGRENFGSRENFGRENFGRENFGRENFGRENFGRENFGREDIARENFGERTFGGGNFDCANKDGGDIASNNFEGERHAPGLRFENNRSDSNFGNSLGFRNNTNNFGNRDNDYYRPAQIFDYQNRSQPEVLIPSGKVVDYGHKPSAPLPTTSFNRDNSEFVPVKTIDYGHASNTARPGNQLPDKNVNQTKMKVNRWNQDPKTNENELHNQAHVFEGNNNENKLGDFESNREANKNPNTHVESTESYDVSEIESENLQEYPKNKWILQNPESRQRPGPPTKRGKRNSVQYQTKTVTDELEQDETDDVNNEIEENFEEISDSECNLIEDPITSPEKVRSLFPSVSDSNKTPLMVIPSNENNNTIPIDEILFKPGRLTRPKNVVIIIRGPPGSGKSHVAKLIKDKEIEMGGHTPRILSIDDYFMVENDYEEKCPKTGRKIPKKEILYEYEKGMEPTYMQYLIKSFKKTVNDHLFDFIIVDCCNHSLRTFNEFYNAARDGNFSPFVIDLKCDLDTCLEHNVHDRKEEEIKEIIKNYQDCPGHYIKLDVSNLLENVVEMEDVSDLEDHFVADSEEVIELEDEEAEEETSDNNDNGFLKSKWDADPTTENLARLDGTSKPISKRGTATLEEYLQVDGWEPPTSNTNGKKRVRWADIEEKRAQDKMRAIGFVVGQTDWNRMMDPTSGSGALTKTKYIERLNKRR